MQICAILYMLDVQKKWNFVWEKRTTNINSKEVECDQRATWQSHSLVCLVCMPWHVCHVVRTRFTWTTANLSDSTLGLSFHFHLSPTCLCSLLLALGKTLFNRGTYDGLEINKIMLAFFFGAHNSQLTRVYAPFPVCAALVFSESGGMFKAPVVKPLIEPDSGVYITCSSYFIMHCTARLHRSTV